MRNGGAASVDGDVVQRVLAWFELNQRDLPWRSADRTPWSVLVSEVMLQQTPVARVLPVWTQWLARWPTPAALAAEPPGEAVRAWGRLGYPRRALRLHAAAVALVREHDGEVPDQESELRALPGVGQYTAAAVLAFGFGQRAVVLDTNVRRVLARLLCGTEHPAASVTAAERRAASALLRDDGATAARWSVAVMELGALVCTAAAPDCPRCPVSGACAWLAADRPPGDRPRPVQRFAGTDRQVRGRLMAVVREASGPVTHGVLAAAWTVDPIQRQRALDGLVADGLVERIGAGDYRLPGVTHSSTWHSST